MIQKEEVLHTTRQIVTLNFISLPYLSNGVAAGLDITKSAPLVSQSNPVTSENTLYNLLL